MSLVVGPLWPSFLLSVVCHWWLGATLALALDGLDCSDTARRCELQVEACVCETATLRVSES